MRKSVRFLCLVVAVLLLSSLSASAGDPFRKLGRGIVNVGFGALEIPFKIYDVNKEDGGLAAVTYGSLKGIGYFVAREVVGVIEIATFPMPLPGSTDSPSDSGWGYGPWMEPEFVVGPDHDIYNIVYQDLPVD
ncbi:MAG TPA: exosortase system-associated protein, TIGR04073 family [Victivallales bacterium]|mgnify:CR=1 FL=1|nr:exosortase system-associated protein, TIGR04073 family [Victivallales bacterium]